MLLLHFDPSWGKEVFLCIFQRLSRFLVPAVRPGSQIMDLLYKEFCLTILNSRGLQQISKRLMKESFPRKNRLQQWTYAHFNWQIEKIITIIGYNLLASIRGR